MSPLVDSSEEQIKSLLVESSCLTMRAQEQINAIGYLRGTKEKDVRCNRPIEGSAGYEFGTRLSGLLQP